MEGDDGASLQPVRNASPRPIIQQATTHSLTHLPTTTTYVDNHDGGPTG